MKNISFSGPMMRALLDGRKTQTRRGHTRRGHKSCKAKYAVRDLVWVKEGLVKFDHNYAHDQDGCVRYEADDKLCFDSENIQCKWQWKRDKLLAMFCPKWASRVTLRITRVRADVIDAISLKDAKAEGFKSIQEFWDYFAELYFNGDIDASLGAMVWIYDFEVVNEANS